MIGLPREYQVWRGIRCRCYTKSAGNYANYGGRGIKMCDRWRDAFIAFYEDMGEKPSDKHSIERLDNDGDYSPENCTWAIPKEQARNRRSTVKLTVKGETKCLEDWAEQSDVDASTIRRRMKRMSHEDAVFSSSQQRKKKYIEANGKRLTLDGWAEELNLSRSAIKRRLKTLPITKALNKNYNPREHKADTRTVEQLTKTGELLNEFHSLSEAGRVMGINFRNIASVCVGKRKTAGGYIWRYKHGRTKEKGSS